MQVGDVYILHNVQYPGIENQPEDTFIRVVITETRKVPGDYSDNMYDGFKATDENGVEYTNCWERFYESSFSPYSRWWCPSSETSWFCVTEHGPDHIPAKPNKLIDKFFDNLSWCDKHHILFRAADRCYGCHLKLKAYVKISAWKGWI